MHESLERDQLYVTVDMLILTVREGRLNLLLSRRTEPPYAGRWALPGRFVGHDESAETAVKRLLDEMLPVKEAFMEQLYTFTGVNRDPRGRVISTAYLVIVPQRQLEGILGSGLTPFRRFEVKADEESETEFIAENGKALVSSDLAFDHGRIIETGINRLRGKIEYTDVGFRFLNDTEAFSLGELQTVYEAVLGKELDDSNFRRTIRRVYEETGLIIPTDREERTGRGRPAALYRLRKRGERI